MDSHVSPHLVRAVLNSRAKLFFQEINAMDVVIANLDQPHARNKADAANNIVIQTRLLKDFVH
jgi:hypothetical protein